MLITCGGIVLYMTRSPCVTGVAMQGAVRVTGHDPHCLCSAAPTAYSCNASQTPLPGTIPAATHCKRSRQVTSGMVSSSTARSREAERQTVCQKNNSVLALLQACRYSQCTAAAVMQQVKQHTTHGGYLMMQLHWTSSLAEHSIGTQHLLKTPGGQDTP